MNCPNCEIPLTLRKIGRVSVDECSRCRGIWFDKNELEEAKDEIDPELRWMNMQIWHQQPRFQLTDQLHDCPKCKKVTMQLITYQEPDVDVSYCPSCEGSWLDVDDFEKIIDALGKEADSRSGRHAGFSAEYTRPAWRIDATPKTCDRDARTTPVEGGSDRFGAARPLPGVARMRSPRSGPLGGDQQIGGMIAEGNVEAVEFLLARGADAGARTRIDDYATPLEEAEILGRAETAAVLREKAG